MLQYLKLAEFPNLKEACGILKWFTTLKASASSEQLTCCMEVLRWLSRHDIPSKYPEKFDVVRPAINATLIRVLENARKQGCKPTEFLKLYKVEVALILPQAALETVLKHDGEWLEVEWQLQELVSSCGLGMQLFGFAIKKTLGAMVCKEIEEHLKQLTQATKITADLVRKARQDMQAKLKLIPNVEAIPERRTIQAARDQQQMGRGSCY
jgi:hypothetical protein